MTHDTDVREQVVRDLLVRAADDTGRPLRTDLVALTSRARADRRRRRRATTAGAALLSAAAVVGVVALPRLLGGDATLPAPTPAPPATSPPANAVVPHTEVVRRCLPQLDKYGALPMYAADPGRVAWRVANADLDYRVGDVVSLRARNGSSNAVLCRVPEPGREEAPVPFDTFVADPADGDRVAALCTEAYHGGDAVIDPSSRFPLRTRWRDTIPDLRGSEPVTTAGTGPVVVALLERGGQDYRCLLGPVTWDVGVNEVGPEWPSRGGRIWLDTVGTGAGAKSIVDDERTYVVGAGRTDVRAATIEVTLPDGSSAATRVRDGVWSLAAEVPGFGGLVPLPTEVRASDGELLWSGDASGL